MKNLRSFPLLVLVLLALSAIVATASTAFSQATQKRYFAHRTTGAAFTPHDIRIWRSTVPYKKQVRIVSELFDFPSEYDSAREEDLRIQFVEYVMKTNPEAIRKMRLHTELGFSPTKYDPANKNHVRQYAELTTDPKLGNWTFEIILIKGFKYVPDKYVVGPNPGKKSPLYTEAMSILYDTK